MRHPDQVMIGAERTDHLGRRWKEGDDSGHERAIGLNAEIGDGNSLSRKRGIRRNKPLRFILKTLPLQH
jgi:hypothetical protein